MTTSSVGTLMAANWHSAKREILVEVPVEVPFYCNVNPRITSIPIRRLFPARKESTPNQHKVKRINCHPAAISKCRRNLTSLRCFCSTSTISGPLSSISHRRSEFQRQKGHRECPKTRFTLGENADDQLPLLNSHHCSQNGEWSKIS